MAKRQPATTATNLVVDRRSLVDQAVDVIRQQILNGGFEAGSRLVEARLAERMWLSRGTIRAALRELTHEGLVCATPYTGWAVVEFTAHDAWELYTLRGAVEALAARLAAEAISPEKAERLHVAYAELLDAAQGGDRRLVVEADVRLHKTVIELTQNQRLVDQYEQIEQQIRICIALSDRRWDLDEIANWHATLVRAIADGDAAAAERIARDNADRNGQELVAQFAQNNTGVGCAQAPSDKEEESEGPGR